MRRPCQNVLFSGLLIGTVGVTGCGSMPRGSQQPALYAQPTAPAQDRTDPSRQFDMRAIEEPPTNAEVQRLIAQLNAAELERDKLKQQLSDQFMESVRLRQKEIASGQDGGTQPAAAQADAALNPGQANVATSKTPADLASASRQALFDALVRKIAQGQDPARSKALMAAAISVAGENKALNPELLEALDPRAREQVARFQQMLEVAFDELAGNPDKVLTRREMMVKLDEVFGEQPLEIGALELCRAVESFGVYEPFAATRFLAGQRNRVLVYVEVENFHHQPTEDGKYEVKLEMQVELYDARGEMTVWRSGTHELPDVSRNRRRDFFVVYPVDLPARLSVGTYRLKVRVADKHTSSICEKTLHNIEIVADQKMVGGQ